MGFQSALSGLNAASKNIDVIGNNVANANTIGFKIGRAVFADVYANALGGSGTNSIGIGVKITDVTQEFTQGNVTVTNNPLDLAINGQGFFRFDNNGATTYSRNGQLHLDKSGYLVNADDLKLTGYGVDALQNIVSSSPVPLRLATGDIVPRSTTALEATLNLDSRATAIVVPFNAANAATYTNSTSTAIYDSLGNAHALTMFFTKTAVAGQWNLQATLDGGAPAGIDLGAGAGNPITLAFNASGALTTAQPIAGITIVVPGGAITPQTVSLDFTGTSQFGAEFGTSALTQDGYTSGRLVGFDIADNGTIQGRYTNGQANVLGQVVLANFPNPQGLASLGDNMWGETSTSGLPLVGTPRTSSLGTLQSAAVEESNVDLTQELVNMITAQRIYQANAQTIKTQDQVLQTIVNLK